MWFYPLLVVLVILAIVGGTLAGGIYTIVLIPLAVIAAISAIVYLVWGRALEGSGGGATEATAATRRPLPSQSRRPSGRVRTTPERLADARRQQQ
jgi:hypothetical protein